MKLCVDSPTQAGTILDLKMGNKSDQVTGVSVEELLGSSDHYIGFKIVMN